MGCRKMFSADTRTDNDVAAIGIGSMILFIAMILVAGIAASVMLQTMDNLQGQASKTGRETIGDVSTGVRVGQISGYIREGTIDQIAILIEPISGSDVIDLSTLSFTLTETSKQVFFSYNHSCYQSSIQTSLFETINASALQANEFGVLVIRDSDLSCKENTTVINAQDTICLLINTTKAFSGIPTRTEVRGSISSEYGIPCIIRFTTPISLIHQIIELYP